MGESHGGGYGRGDGNGGLEVLDVLMNMDGRVLQLAGEEVIEYMK